jgi:hypothetical protein
MQHPSLDRNDDDDNHQYIPFAVATEGHISTNGDWFWVDIVSATYAPCEEICTLQHLQCQDNSSSSSSNMHNSTATPTTPPRFPPHLTRDVTPLVRALFIQQETETTGIHNYTSPRFTNEESMSTTTSCGSIRWIRLPAVQSGQRRVQLSLLHDLESSTSTTTTTTSNSTTSTTARDDTALMSMGLNGLFGDPAPGLSKRLHILYRILEQDPATVVAMDTKAPFIAPICTVNFAEHERVYLRHGYWTGSSGGSSTTTAITPSTAVIVANSRPGNTDPSAPRNDGGDTTKYTEDHVSADNTFWLPWILPFLPVRQRVQCRLVCRTWQNVIVEWGIAVAITDTDYITGQPLPSDIITSASTGRTITPPPSHGWTSTVLRGLLSHSFASLQRLFLSHSPDLEPDDLHFAIPHLRKLQTLDISRCVQLDDATLQLLADCVSATLEVLYIKGLIKVSDRGVTAIAQACRRLKVLDLSYLTAVTDQSMMEIGRHLTQLRAIYLRENYHVTNASINVLTESCTSLEQLTLWGSIRLNHLRFPSPHDQPAGVPSRFALLSSTTGGRLVLLNLWGCHSLRDDAAQSLIGMTHLRTLIVSECHQLTDSFVVRCLYRLGHHSTYCFSHAMSPFRDRYR